MPTAWQPGMTITADRLLGDFIDWQDLPIKSPVSDGAPGQSLHRIRRHPDGQIELQLDVAISTTASGSIATLPTWARPTTGLRRAAVATNSVNAILNSHVDLTPSGDVQFFALTSNFSAITWISVHITYTP
ncbi:hypothetical protein ACWCO9_19520 [Streptomyces sp. NPDC001937]